jgi:hypothetical protein
VRSEIHGCGLSGCRRTSLSEDEATCRETYDLLIHPRSLTYVVAELSYTKRRAFWWSGPDTGVARLPVQHVSCKR